MIKCTSSHYLVLLIGFLGCLCSCYPAIAQDESEMGEGQREDVQSVDFFCDTSGEAPTTVVRISEKVIPLISFRANYFEEQHSLEEHCQIASANFQKYHQQGSLRFLTTGRRNRYPVICATSQAGGGCDGILFTLHKGSNARSILLRLFNITYRNPVLRSPGPIYINLYKYIQELDPSIQELDKYIQELDPSDQEPLWPDDSK